MVPTGFAAAMPAVLAQDLSARERAAKEKYETDRFLAVRQKFNSQPKENPIDNFVLFWQNYLETGFLNHPGDTLEVGAGNNGLGMKFVSDKAGLEQLKQKGNIVITDKFPNMVKACQALPSLQAPEITIECADASRLHYATGSFARVVANYMVYALDNVQKAIEEMARVLSPDGVAKIVTMDETLHNIEQYEICQRAKERVESQGVKIGVEFPRSAPAIAPFCKGNAMSYLEKSFGIIEVTEFRNAILVYDTVQCKNETISGPKLVVEYLQSLEFIQAASLPEVFFDAVRDIVAERIAADGVFRISRCEVMYTCSQPIQNMEVGQLLRV